MFHRLKIRLSQALGSCPKKRSGFEFVLCSGEQHGYCTFQKKTRLLLKVRFDNTVKGFSIHYN
jgi:hypothetical protein